VVAEPAAGLPACATTFTLAMTRLQSDPHAGGQPVVVILGLDNRTALYAKAAVAIGLPAMVQALEGYWRPTVYTAGILSNTSAAGPPRPSGGFIVVS